jgi:hypothetical protein
LTSDYPHYTPYSFSGNKVIAYRELEGLEELIVITDLESGKPSIRSINGKSLKGVIFDVTNDKMKELTQKKSLSSARKSVLKRLGEGDLVKTNGVVTNTKRIHTYDVEKLIDGTELTDLTRGVNFGQRDGITTKGISQYRALSLKGKAGLFNFFSESLGMVGDLISIATSIQEDGSINALNFSPLGFITEQDNIEQQKFEDYAINQEYNEAIRGGIKNTKVFLDDWSNFEQLSNYMVVDISGKMLFDILNGKITDFSNLIDRQWASMSKGEKLNHSILVKQVYNSKKKKTEARVVEFFIKTENEEKE